jgi:hypothetical protein
MPYSETLSTVFPRVPFPKTLRWDSSVCAITRLATRVYSSARWVYCVSPPTFNLQIIFRQAWPFSKDDLESLCCLFTCVKGVLFSHSSLESATSGLVRIWKPTGNTEDTTLRSGLWMNSSHGCGPQVKCEIGKTGNTRKLNRGHARDFQASEQG